MCGDKPKKIVKPTGSLSTVILSAAQEVDGLMTTQEFISFLLGLERAKTVKLQLNTHPYFGATKEKDREEVEREVSGLLNTGKLLLKGKTVMKLCSSE